MIIIIIIIIILIKVKKRIVMGCTEEEGWGGRRAQSCMGMFGWSIVKGVERSMRGSIVWIFGQRIVIRKNGIGSVKNVEITITPAACANYQNVKAN